MNMLPKLTSVAEGKAMLTPRHSEPRPKRTLRVDGLFGFSIRVPIDELHSLIKISEISRGLNHLLNCLINYLSSKFGL